MMTSSLRLVLLAGSFALFAAACSSSPTGTCSMSTCPNGCCDDNNNCQPGNTNAACGSGALTSSVGTNGSVCNARSCIPMGRGGGASGGGTGGGGGRTPPTFNLTFAASCGAIPTCGGHVVGTWFLTSGCVEDSAFSQLSALCSTAVVSNKSGTASGSLVFTGTTVTRTLSGTVNFIMTATDPACVASCSSLPSVVAGSGLTGACAANNSTCNCSWSMPISESGGDTYTVSNGVITLTSGAPRTFAYCVTGTSMQYFETTPGNREPVLYGLTKQ